MIEANDITDYLVRVKERNPEVVHGILNKGDQFSTHPYPTATVYRVDDPLIYQEFDHDDDFNQFLVEIGERIRGTTGLVFLQLFPPGVLHCALSEVTRRKLGTCLEKSAIVALRAQVQFCRSFLVKGLLAVHSNGQMNRQFHAFNVIEGNDNIPQLVDVQNPITFVNGETRTLAPFNFPLRGYDPCEKTFILEEPAASNIRWTYGLPVNIKDSESDHFPSIARF